MFNFHKPKVYRSTQGCCICKAKSSSSRFTDSKKYEEAFERCFELQDKRSGEVCNACVLLVKRWRNLPENSDRNWKHVVDARAGPGTRTLSKTKSLKSKKRKLKEKQNEAECKRRVEEDVAKVLVNVANGDGRSIAMDIKDMDINEDCDSPSPTPSDEAYPLKHSRSNNKQATPVNEPSFGYGFLDPSLWRRVKVCCGVIFEGPCGAVVIEPRLMTPCSGRHRVQKKELAPPPVTEMKEEVTEVKMEVETIVPSVVVETIAVAVVDKQIVADTGTGKVFNDASSDSGYDESSNQGENVVNSKQILPGSQAQKVNNLHSN